LVYLVREPDPAEASNPWALWQNGYLNIRHVTPGTVDWDHEPE